MLGFSVRKDPQRIKTGSPVGRLSCKLGKRPRGHERVTAGGHEVETRGTKYQKGGFPEFSNWQYYSFLACDFPYLMELIFIKLHSSTFFVV